MAKSVLASSTFGSPTVTDGTNRFLTLGGGSYSTVGTHTGAPVREAGTFGKMFTYASQNDVGSNTTVTLRINTVASSLLTTYGSSQTGIKENTTNNPSIANTDEVDIEVAVPSVAGTHTFTLEMYGLEYTPTDTSKTVQFFTKAHDSAALLTTASSTFYHAIVANATTPFSAAVNAEMTVYSPFTSSNFYIDIDANARTSDTVFGTTVNSSPGAQSVTYTSTQTGIKEDSVHTDSLNVNDTFGYYQTNGTGTNAISGFGMFSCYSNTSNSFPLFSAQVISINFNTTNYYAITSQISVNTTEANRQYYPQTNFTLSKLQARIQTNTIATSATTITLRKNGSNANQNLSINAGATGTFTDTTNSDLIAVGAGNEINYLMVTPNTSGAISMRNTSVWASTAVDSFTPRSRHTFHR